ncbi:hypothetical protein TIFTF001_011554 [Ficus carica]|uniref:Uncharacterized protein n=1 Tax=Ficus carica TaxID=3494 RepID=A0AA88A033_FICCA|nr:hypothetical protein TIFTF001_011554 [Ficus carica]
MGGPRAEKRETGREREEKREKEGGGCRCSSPAARRSPATEKTLDGKDNMSRDHLRPSKDLYHSPTQKKKKTKYSHDSLPIMKDPEIQIISLPTLESHRLENRTVDRSPSLPPWSEMSSSFVARLDLELTFLEKLWAIAMGKLWRLRDIFFFILVSIFVHVVFYTDFWWQRPSRGEKIVTSTADGVMISQAMTIRTDDNGVGAISYEVEIELGFFNLGLGFCNLGLGFIIFGAELKFL